MALILQSRERPAKIPTTLRGVWENNTSENGVTTARKVTSFGTKSRGLPTAKIHELGSLALFLTATKIMALARPSATAEKAVYNQREVRVPPSAVAISRNSNRAGTRGALKRRLRPPSFEDKTESPVASRKRQIGPNSGTRIVDPDNTTDTAARKPQIAKTSKGKS
jgi:hypothetical protein